MLGGLAVILGAFGAHLLKDTLPAERLETWEIAVRYHLLHALAMCLVAAIGLQVRSRLLTVAGWCFGLGILVFSGLLYTLALSGLSILGAIVPLGGLLMISGWAVLAAAAVRLTRTTTPSP
jgi:uncharacterized membrane protein YgdD (TMEM256/DUF423 family)